MKKSTNRNVALALLFACLVGATLVLTVASLLTSNAISGTVNPSPSLALTINGTAVNGRAFNTGDTLRFQTTLAQGMTDKIVTFHANATTIGSVGSINRVATFDYVVTNAGTTADSYSWTATVD